MLADGSAKEKQSESWFADGSTKANEDRKSGADASARANGRWDMVADASARNEKGSDGRADTSARDFSRKIGLPTERQARMNSDGFADGAASENELTDADAEG